MKARWLFLGLASLLMASPALAARFDLTPASYASLPGWMGSSEPALKSQSLTAFVASCEKIIPMAPEKDIGAHGGIAREWQPLCYKARGTLKRVNESTLPAEREEISRRFFEAAFLPYEVKGEKRGLFTGYFVPEVKASRKRQGKYTHPIYRTPPDLDKDGIYATRAEINAGLLKGKGLEIAYAEDPVELFFMQVQGSGTLRFPDGSTGFVSYAAKNNQPYTAIGKVLVEKGALKSDKVDAPAIIAWLRAHPAEAQKVMEKNASYIFFREAKAGAVGAQGVALTPFISLAVDKEMIPLGAPLWLDTSLPQKGGKEKPFRALMVAQDAGTAILGAVRGDVFFGAGSKAEWLAGQMKQPGRYFLLLPRALKVVHGKE
jgi:membrane-bound lytic murein transglycosylase A